MAAWTAQVNAIGDSNNGSDLVVTVTYFDATDTQFATPLFGPRVFTFSANTPVADLRAAVVTAGQNARNVQAKVAAAQSVVGTTINVP